uniref:ubiquitinyl hydrolase 1 n=1 Tax=Colobus angolensis palliatus TaxID=336983 RepID=A0A2K5KGM7_COLAP
MESIFHEKQEGSLSAQHCLNNLLQGEYFSPVELSSIAHQLDEEERMRMAEGGVTSEDYHTFLQHNALKVWGLELILFNSPEYQRLRIDPINERSFICNYKEHWFTVRKLGKQWFNLNSVLMGPELVSDTYLALFLAQLQQEGYPMFVVKGDLPDCEADQLLQMIRVQQMHRPKPIGEELAQLKEVHKTDLERVLEANDGSAMLDEDEEDLQRALALSRQEIDMEDEEADLRRAIQLSMQVAEIYLKIFHGHQVQTLLQKSFGRDEKPTLKNSSKSSNSSSSSRSSRGTYQDRVHIHVKGQPPVQEHLGVI